jgi:hypothetical protein
METLINVLNSVRSVIMLVWFVFAHITIYTVVAAKTCLWVGLIGWVVLVWNISGSLAFSWGDVKIVGIIVIVLSVFMALVRMISLIILVVRANRLAGRGETEKARDLEPEFNRNVYNIPGFTFHFAKEEEVTTK